MGNVIIHATMSLDGFMAGTHDEMDWVFKYGSLDNLGEEVMKTIGAVILGKRTLDISLNNNQLPYGGTIKVPQFVVTHKGQDNVTIGGLPFTFVTEGIERAVEQAKMAAGSKNVSTAYDGGTTWNAGMVATFDSTDVYALDAQHVWAEETTSNTLHFSSDGGKTWVQLSQTPHHLGALSFADTHNGWAIGDAGNLYQTANGGTSWQRLS